MHLVICLMPKVVSALFLSLSFRRSPALQDYTRTRISLSHVPLFLARPTLFLFARKTKNSEPRRHGMRLSLLVLAFETRTLVSYRRSTT